MRTARGFFWAAGRPFPGAAGGAFFRGTVVPAALALVNFTVLAQSPLTDAELRGQRLYLEGLRADGQPLAATSGDAGVALPLAFVACANCHGRDGRGKTEAGTTVPDIRWETLSKPYTLTLATGRSRPPYEATTFFAALTQGVDSAGRPLDAAMPRFQLSAPEATDLLAWLKQIATAPATGVTDEVIRVGALLPADPALAAEGERDRQLFAACCDDLDRAGGLYRRRLELVPIGDSPATWAGPPVLALLASTGSAAAGRASEAARLPLLCAVASPGGDHSRYVFSVYPGAAERARALARFALTRWSGPPHLALLYRERTTLPAVREAILAATRSLAVVDTVPLLSADATIGPDPDAVAQTLQATEVQGVFLLGAPGDFAEVLARGARRGWHPLQFWLESPPSAGSGDDQAFATRPNLPTDLAPEAPATFRRWLRQHDLPERDLPRQMAVAATAQTLFEALKQTGRELTREKLVDTLDTLHDFRSGLSPPIGFSPRRHLGIAGVYVVPLARSQLSPPPVWVPLDESVPF
jgi:ABC-type branched-subunit amino acid transport system substrate-binding protein/mono/diheme cytochrome c family protein